MAAIDPFQVILGLRRQEQPGIAVLAVPGMGLTDSTLLTAKLLERGPPAIGFMGLDPGRHWYPFTLDPGLAPTVQACEIELDGAMLRVVPSANPRDPWVALVLESAEPDGCEGEIVDYDQTQGLADASRLALEGTGIQHLHTGLLRRAGLEGAPALRAAGVVGDQGELTLGALLCLVRGTFPAVPPCWTIVVERYHADPRTVVRHDLEPVERRTLEPPLPIAIDAIVDDLSVEQPFLHRDSSYAAHALREILVNAVTHRHYPGKEDEPVKVSCHPDRIVVTSPGAWAGPEDEQADPTSDPSARIPNPGLHALMARLGLCRQQGMGLERARLHARAIGMRLEIERRGLAVRASLIVDRQLSLELDTPGAERQSKTRGSAAAVREERLVEYLRRRESASKKEIAEALGIPEPTVAVTLKELRDKGRVMTTERAARSPRQRYRVVKDRA